MLAARASPNANGLMGVERGLGPCKNISTSYCKVLFGASSRAIARACLQHASAKSSKVGPSNVITM